MKSIKLGNTQYEASQVALGIMRMDALSVDDAAKVIETAHDAGINFIDSADIYGDNKSEEVFGKALKQSSLSRNDFKIQSKGGIILDTRYDFSKQHLLDAVDGELKRIGTDYLDSFLLHRPDPLMEPDQIGKPLMSYRLVGRFATLVFQTSTLVKLTSCKPTSASV